MMLILVMSGSYCCLWFLPMPEEPQSLEPLLESVYELNDTVYIKKYSNNSDVQLERYTCQWNCTTDEKFQVYLSNTTYINTIYIEGRGNISCSLLHMEIDAIREEEMTCVPKKDCNLLCYDDSLSKDVIEIYNRSKREVGGTKTNTIEVVEKDRNKVGIIPVANNKGQFTLRRDLIYKLYSSTV